MEIPDEKQIDEAFMKLIERIKYEMDMQYKRD
jgi:hypothetical protein